MRVPDTQDDVVLWTARGGSRTFLAVARFMPQGYVLRMFADGKLLWSRTFDTRDELLAEATLLRAIHRATAPPESTPLLARKIPRLQERRE